MSRPAAPRLEDFPFQVRDSVRFADTDAFGHVNNAVFSTFLESGRALMLMDDAAFARPQGTGYALVRLAIDYRGEIHWPGEVVIGTRIQAIGGASLTFSQGIFQNGTCCASAETVVVLFDLSARHAVRFPDPLRAALTAASRP